ncbi:MAG: TrmH family RNA methyltransferase [Thiotrichaceae bacterium]
MANDKNIQLKHEETTFMAKQFPIRLLANKVGLAGNIGSLFRVADAFGVEKLYLSGLSETASNLKIRKAARSTHKKVDYSFIESEVELVTKLRSEGYTIISLEITSTSQDLRKFVREQKNSLVDKVCLIVGSESEGVEQGLLDVSDYTVHLPMYGDNTSMNVVTATAIALYELVNVWV